ncbi:MAG: glycosyltransferase family 39 protein [Synechococcales cyanobacterium C42_A2020_086]|jgi:4-amino-4-deoxy-L-arabinose transferase-like glycosyltransferase|nr:glycosyltransferase family 39 protein [Synechococcales cyanobacterium C42_A2020_086]
MSQNADMLKRSREHWTERQIDLLWQLVWLFAALLLLTINLGGVPLKDWDEGLVAQVAREMHQASFDQYRWLYPTLWGAPYFNKPPLIHGLIALAYRLGGVTETMARLPSALLTAVSVPLFYRLAREVFHRRLPAVFAAMVYLTSLPVIRNGRFAMLDGAILFWLILMMFCLLRSRRDYRYLLGAGLGFGGLCLTKGVLVGVLLGGIGLGFLAWDTPRLLKSPFLWLGIGIGSVPVALWYGAQWLHYGSAFLGNNLVEQSLQRIWTDVEDNGAPPWYYLLEVLKYGAPWLLFLPLGYGEVWSNRNLSWAKLALVWSGVYFVAISLMATKLPWYVLPLFPALALVSGAQLAEFWQRGQHNGIRQLPPVPYSRIWVGLFGLLALVGWAGVLYFSYWSTPPEPSLVLVFAAVGMTFSLVAVLIARQNPQFIPLLGWGTFVALLLLMQSPHWAWEVAEAYPVQPVASLIQRHVPAGVPIFTSYPYHRPSLNFYSERRVNPASEQELRRAWRRESQPFLLLDASALATLNLKRLQAVGAVEEWTLVTKKSSTAAHLPDPIP